MVNSHLTPHFTLTELTKSATAVRLGFDNTPDANAVDNLKLLCERILEPIRANFGKPFTPLSGYRSAALNMTIGGSTKSQHMHGQAADIEIQGVDNYLLAIFASNNLDYDQIILEHYYPDDPMSGWVHISTTANRSRRQCLTYNKQHGYREGLINNLSEMIDKRNITNDTKPI